MQTAKAEAPALSVVVPVRNGEHFLPHCLAALRASRSDGWSWELIVVDDNSSDGSADIAGRLADKTIRLPRHLKPSAARNRGADAARGAILVFVDADVCVHPDALGLLYDTLSRRPDVSAVFGAYDVSPAAPGLVSQYRNLLHHYFHERGAGETVTFWSGIGAIRREAFESVGGFDEAQYPLEDVELGYRLCERAHQIVLRPKIQGTHLKRWTLLTMVVTDVLDRGVPWIRLLFNRRRLLDRPTLNVRRGEQVLTSLMGLGGVLAVVGLALGNSLWVTAAAGAAALTVAGDWPFTAWLAQQRGWWFALRTIPLRLLYYTLNVLSVCLGLISLLWHERRPSSLLHARRPVPQTGALAWSGHSQASRPLTGNPGPSTTHGRAAGVVPWGELRAASINAERREPS